ncbi:hypothetical protein ACFLS8_04560 [Chloroflexota bacterium]
MRDGYFSARRDSELLATGNFIWCLACLVAKPNSEKSPDLRYCQGCYESLLKEADLLGTSRPTWIPRPVLSSKPTAPQPNPDIKNAGTTCSTSIKQSGVLVASNTENTQLYQNLPQDRSKPNVGGRPKKDIPVELIRKLAGKGKSIGAIVKTLKSRGAPVSAMSVSRVLSGARK